MFLAMSVIKPPSPPPPTPQGTSDITLYVKLTLFYVQSLTRSVIRTLSFPILKFIKLFVFVSFW